MQRRSLLKLGALTAGAAMARAASPQLVEAGAASDDSVRRVLLVTKCHLDVGFTQTQKLVVQKYQQVYFPQAMRIAAELRQRGRDRYIWTTGSWLLYQYLEQAGPAERKVAEESIAAGDLSWHALPFNWQTEMLTRSLIEGALGFSAALDRRFGVQTIAAKMTDVPGHSRGLIAPLAAAGVRMLDIGVNAASSPPQVPDVFLWQDPNGGSLAMLYHLHDYGSILRIPGTDLAVDVEVRTDNSGPHTLEEIAAIYAKLRARFRNAKVEAAATLNQVAAAVDAVRDQLPVVRQEIGDTWIYGVASDPVKVARYRAAARLRQQWLAQGRFHSADATDLQLLQWLLLAPEHTWGTDTKSYLDDAHYRPADLESVVTQPNYQTMQRSWQEKRDDIDTALVTLPTLLQTEAKRQLALLVPARPSSAGMRPYDLAQPLRAKHYTLALDLQTGAIISLENNKTGKQWASALKPLALFTYQTLSAADYEDFLARYIKTKADWAPKDFGKPGIENFGAVSREWHPQVAGGSVEQTHAGIRLLVQLRIPDEAAAASRNLAWPQEIYCELWMPADDARIELTLSTFGKRASRMPEAMWFTFDPVVGTSHVAEPLPGWSMRKVDQDVNVFEVVSGGGRGMHAITDRITYTDTDGNALSLTTLDAPLVAVGKRSPLNFSLAQPDPSSGIHFGLFNNAWGTNYLQWCSGDWLYRFAITA